MVESINFKERAGELRLAETYVQLVVQKMCYLSPYIPLQISEGSYVNGKIILDFNEATVVSLEDRYSSYVEKAKQWWRETEPCWYETKPRLYKLEQKV